MSAESGWLGTAVGIAVGMLARVVGLGNVLWPQHPQWALFSVVVAVAVVSMAILERNERRSSNRVHT